MNARDDPNSPEDVKWRITPAQWWYSSPCRISSPIIICAIFIYLFFCLFRWVWALFSDTQRMFNRIHDMFCIQKINYMNCHLPSSYIGRQWICPVENRLSIPEWGRGFFFDTVSRRALRLTQPLHGWQNLGPFLLELVVPRAKEDWMSREERQVP